MLEPYLIIELIFNLLCVCRHLAKPSSQALRRAMYQRGLYFGTFDDLPRFSFWVRLCRNAALLDEAFPPRPTLYVSDWLALSIPNQFSDLLEAWQEAPTRPDLRGIRQQLPRLILEGSELSPTYRKELVGLQALGICESDGLTTFGYMFLNKRLDRLPDEKAKPWQFFNNELQVPYPPDWGLLWHLEAFLDPIDPGIYLLSEESQRLAVQRGALEKKPSLLQILERGLGESAPTDLVQRLKAQPLLRILPGTVLEFTSSEELKELRQARTMRRDLNHILSPRHVFLGVNQAPQIINRLHRRGLLAENDIQRFCSQDGYEPNDKTFTATERTYLFSLMLIADGLNISLAPPLGLLAKLTTGLGIKLRASAASKAKEMLDQLGPKPDWVPEEEPPPLPTQELVEKIERAIRKELPIDILYQAADRSMPEHRHLTPLLVEQRGLRFYLIAYCHKRRANRTFRLDRMTYLDEPPS